jgi:hypothetical protein
LYEAATSGIGQDQAINLMTHFSFALIKSTNDTFQGTITIHHNEYACNFEYQSKYYQLTFTFSNVTSVDLNKWYTPIINITKNGIFIESGKPSLIEENGQDKNITNTSRIECITIRLGLIFPIHKYSYMA